MIKKTFRRAELHRLIGQHDAPAWDAAQRIADAVSRTRLPPGGIHP